MYTYLTKKKEKEKLQNVLMDKQYSRFFIFISEIPQTGKPHFLNYIHKLEQRTAENFGDIAWRNEDKRKNNWRNSEKNTERNCFLLSSFFEWYPTVARQKPRVPNDSGEIKEKDKTVRQR